MSTVISGSESGELIISNSFVVLIEGNSISSAFSITILIPDGLGVFCGTDVRYVRLLLWLNVVNLHFLQTECVVHKMNNSDSLFRFLIKFRVKERHAMHHKTG